VAVRTRPTTPRALTSVTEAFPVVIASLSKSASGPADWARIATQRSGPSAIVRPSLRPGSHWVVHISSVLMLIGDGRRDL